MQASHSRVAPGFGLIVALVVIAVVLLGGGYYYSANRAPAPADAGDTAASPRSLRALVGLGQSLTCSFSKTDAEATNAGTIFVAGDKMRGDFTMTASSSGTVASHMIKMGDDIYVWSDALAGQGLKMRATAGAEGSSAQADQSVDWDQEMDYDCGSWRADDSKFALPAGVPAEPVVRGIVVTLVPALAASSWSIALGVLIHLGLAFALGLGLAVVVRLFSRPGRAPYSAFGLVMGVLAAVWAVNFLVALPYLNPDFVRLLPYEVTLLSKLLFGLSAAIVLRAKAIGLR